MASGAPGTETSTPRALRKRTRSGRKGDSATAGLDAAAVSSDEDALRELASVRRLLQRGQRRGFLTHKDVRQGLAATKLRADQIDQVLDILRDGDISIVLTTFLGFGPRTIGTRLYFFADLLSN